jgi:hypothetical protein
MKNLALMPVLRQNSFTLVSTTWGMGCDVAELGFMRSKRCILESDNILAKDGGKK